jgi:hypothetical protein
MSEMDLHGDGEILATESPEEAEIELEAPEADAVEQHTSLTTAQGGGPEPAIDVDEADRYEQQVVVTMDEDDYR